MKTIKTLLYGLAALAATAPWLTSCQDDIDAPATATEVPQCSLQPNTTIFDLKKAYWQDVDNYCTKVEAKENGDHYIISGRVISNDYDGNVFRSLTIQDETAAISFSVYTYNLYMNYRVGQEVVVDATDLYIGKYNGLQQFGYPEWYEAGQCYEASFMAPEIFDAHVHLNGLPEPSKVVIHEFSSFGQIPASSPDDLMRWQSELIRVNNVAFVPQTNSTTGELIPTFSLYHENVNQKVKDANDQEMTLRTSGYCNFWNVKMPEGRGDIVALLSFFSGSYQLLFNSLKQGLVNFGSPTLPKGDKENPWSIDEAREIEQGGSTPSGWVEGYIVGTVGPEVENVTSSADIEWGSEATLANTVVIGATAETRDINSCLVIALPQGSAMRAAVALKDNPGNLGKKLSVRGTLDKFMGTWGVVANNGTAAEYVLEGAEGPVTPPAQGGDGTQASPYIPSQIIAKGANFSQPDAYVKGYIVGAISDKSWSAETSQWEAPFTLNTNVLIADSPTERDWTKCVPVQLPSGAVRDALNLVSNPGNLGREVVLKGEVLKYFGKPGFKTVTEYEFTDGGGSGDVTPPTPPAGGGDGTEATPYNATDIINLGADYTQSGAFLTGYIVGSISDKSWSAETSQWEAPFTLTTNILVADSPTERDWTKCVPVQLPSGEVRTALNLVDNPGNLGKKVTLKGDVAKYFGKPGFKQVVSYTLDGSGSGSGSDTPPDQPSAGTGEGTEASPYNATDIITLGANYTQSGAYLKGYIVGGISDKSWSAETSQWEAPFTLTTNILVADSPTERDWTKCVPVQLPSGAVRTALNLVDHPENLGKEVTLKGDVAKYFGKPGFKAVTEYKF